uniref:Uncharacterized protein n=1 Tax=Anguilla anguilla TaxID=7936 RepID=A0A0E9R563_ANGAN
MDSNGCIHVVCVLFSCHRKKCLNDLPFHHLSEVLMTPSTGGLSADCWHLLSKHE